MNKKYERITVFNTACWRGDLELVKILIKNIKPDLYSYVAFRIACIQGKVDVVEFLAPYFYKLPEVENFLLKDNFDIKPYVLSIVTVLKERDMLADLNLSIASSNKVSKL